MNRIIPTGLIIALSVLCSELAHGAEKPDRPNVVYIALEDITPMMGCYGDTYAKTPVFDKLAEEGIRYTRAYSVGAVCSVSRSSIVTGMYPTSIGTMHHRSRIGAPPAFLKMIPNLMREAGYYTTNNKTDYNIQGAQWHKSKPKDMEGWRHRTDKSQPFFCKFDFAESHSSITKIPEDVIVQQRLNRLKPEDFHDPAAAPIPPYHPDDPAFRKAWSRYYDAVTQVDYRAGEIIDRLKEDGLWDDTIVIVWADHGVGMPRGKHMLWEQGTHVPLIVRYPKKFQHLAPAESGSVVNDLVCLMDLGPSVLKMVGIKPPNYLHGRALLCKSDAKQRDYVVSVRNRLDIRSEMVRSIRDKRYRYQRNFYPHLPFAPYQTAQFASPVYMRWAELARDGKLEGSQQEYALRFKPLEQLYDSKNDPHMINNVADDPAYAEVLEQMRHRLHDWMVETRDMGILEEAEMQNRATGRPYWKVGQELDNYERILETANLQLQGLDAVKDLKARSEDADSLVRFWAVLGLAVVTQTAGAETVEGILPILKKALTDDSVDVRLIASEGLFNLGHYEEALPVLIDAMNHPSAMVQVRVGNILDSQPPDANDQLLPAVGPLEEAIKRFKSQRRIRGSIHPFIRAYNAITGQQLYYRWGMGANGSPKSPMMAVQKKPFVLKEAPPLPKSKNAPAKGKPSTLRVISGKVSVAQKISQHDRAYYAENTEEHVYTNKSGQTMPYRLFVPKDYDPKKKYPLVFHLHGAGSRGNDNAKHLLPWFAGWMDEGVQKEHPCFILMPQCPARQQWANTPWKDGSYTYNKVPISQPMKLAKEIFDKVVAENSIDESRIYAVGLSMGGYGAWNFIMRYPELVAAAVPCCGAGDPSMAYILKDLPIWAFHGDADEIVPFEGSKDMVDAIKQEGGEKIKFTIYKNFGHQAHRRAWKSQELIEWVFKQKLVK